MAVLKDPSSDLSKARRHFAEAERRLAEQRELLDKMRRDGDTAAALKVADEVLRTFEKTLEAMKGHLELEERAHEALNRTSPTLNMGIV